MATETPRFEHLWEVITSSREEMVTRLKNMEENMGLSPIVAEQFMTKIDAMFGIVEGDKQAQKTVWEIASLQVDRFELGLEALEQKKSNERIAAFASVTWATNIEVSDFLWSDDINYWNAA